MAIELGLCQADTNTQLAPLAVLAGLYQTRQILQPLQQVCEGTKNRDFTLAEKLSQVFLSMLAGCTTLSEVETRLHSEGQLAQVWGWPRFADQSTLSRTLDQLSLAQIEQLRVATTHIWRTTSQIQEHNWHGYLWLEYDLSGLPCAAGAEASQKGYFSGKKTPPDAS